MAPGQRKLPHKKSPKRKMSEPAESRGSEAITIAWTVSVTGVLIADLMLVAAHFYARNRHEGQPADILQSLLLLLASSMGALSLVLLPIVWRMRQLKPPLGYAVFAVLVAVAPIIAILTRLVG